MSKSDKNQNATLFLLDPPHIVRKKIMSAVTDTGREIIAREDKPGITNLLNIMSSVTGQPIPVLHTQFANCGYGDFKAAVADTVVALLTDIQEKYEALMADKETLKFVLKEGAEIAQKRADELLSKVYHKIGFIERPQ